MKHNLRSRSLCVLCGKLCLKHKTCAAGIREISEIRGEKNKGPQGLKKVITALHRIIITVLREE